VRSGRGKTVLIHHRFNALAGAFADAAFVVQHAGYGRFPTPLKRAMSLMVSRFCMLYSVNDDVVK
jgi:hypothetical protein